VTAAGAEQLKVALVLPGSITDGTFNAAAYQGLKEAEKKYSIKVSHQENTSPAEMENALANYARDGYDVVIGHGFQFAEAATNVHKRFPKTWFIVNAAKVAEAPNLASVDNRWGDVGYIGGAIAALYSKSGTLGYVGAIPVPVIQEYQEGFSSGAKHEKPEIKVLDAYVGSFSDVAKGKEVALSLIERGADVITVIGNEITIGAVQAAKEKHAYVISTTFDSAAIAPDTIITSVLVNFNVNIDLAVRKVIDKSIEPKNYLLGLNEGGLALAPYYRFEDKIPAADKEKISKLVDDIKAGRIADLPKIR
jgi:basic membrane protein A and related proteins